MPVHNKKWLTRLFDETGPRTILSSAAVIAVASIVSRLLGLVRDRILSSTFGAGMELDAYYAAFRLPDTIFNIVVLGAMAAAFIPIFTDLLAQKKEAHALAMANTVLNVVLVVIVIASVSIFIFMPWLVHVVVKNFNPETKDMTVGLTRVMVLAPLFFSISSIASNILNSYKRFVVYAITPIMYNVGIIIGTIVLVPFIGVYGAAVGVIVGAFMHMAIQIPSVYKLGYRYRMTWKITKEVRHMISLMIPRVIGTAATQINLLVNTFLGASLVVGSISVYNFAQNIQSLPLSVFGISLATAAFPVLATAASQKDTKTFANTFGSTFRQIMFFIIPSTILIILFRAQIVRVVLGSGAFDWEDTIETARTLGYFTLSLFAQALIPLFTRAFYALKDTKTPVLISIFSMIINVVGSFILAPRMGVAGLALSFSVAGVVNATLLLVVLYIREPHTDDDKTFYSIIKMVIAASIMGLLLQGLTFKLFGWHMDAIPGVKQLLANVVDMRTFVGVAAQLVLGSILGLLVYVGLGFLLRLPEAHIVKKLIERFALVKSGKSL